MGSHLFVKSVKLASSRLTKYRFHDLKEAKAKKVRADRKEELVEKRRKRARKDPTGLHWHAAKFLVSTTSPPNIYTILKYLLRQVDLKFITENQTMEFTYEGTPRRFIVQSISTKGSQSPKGDADSLSQELNKLSLEGDNSKPQTKSQIWSTGWDCTVTIVDRSEKITVENPQVRPLPRLAHKMEN